MPPCVRFDDHSLGSKRAFQFRGLQDSVVARELADVIPALERVESAVADGMWAGGFVSYEAAPAFDPGLRVKVGNPEDSFHHLPLVWFGLFDRIEDVENFVPRREGPIPYHVSAWRPSTSSRDYLKAVDEIRELIGAGDTYQVNYTFQMRASYSGEAFELYRDLVLAQKGEFASYLDIGRYRVLSASPELFFRLDGDEITTRPMKGTIRRGRWAMEDQMMANRLETSDKDRAENLMIVDLLRNDLGRIAEVGTVRVDDLLALERFETVWQLTSQISATLPTGTSATDVFRHLFPSGSITGAPKRRTTEIIADLERLPRGVYCGAVGMMTPPDSGLPRAAFNVAIRTVVLDQEEGVAQYGVGGGITWDSRATSEYEEALLKAEVLTTRRPEFGLIETIRYDPDEGLRWLDEHLARMASSARYFGFPFDADRAAAAANKICSGSNVSMVVRIVSSSTGEVASECKEIHAEMFCPRPDQIFTTVRLAVDQKPVSSQDVFLFHKTTNRDVYRVRAKRHPDAQDVLLVNERGEITETTTSNVVVKFGDEWWTPRIDSGLLPGVYRAELLRTDQIRERDIALSELASADAIALINSVRGWRWGDIQDSMALAEGALSLG